MLINQFLFFASASAGATKIKNKNGAPRAVFPFL